MVEVPRTLYAKSGDLHLAYQLLGDGPLDVLLSAYFPVDMLDEEPSIARFQRRLASFSRLVRFNPRGLGLSDPVSPSNPPTLEQWNRDALAVMDTVGIARAALFTFGWNAMEAVTLAVTFPDRVSRLIIVNGSARWAWAPNYPAGTSRDEMDAYDKLIFEPDAVERGLDVVALMNPSVANNSSYREWWDRAGNRGASPAMAKAISRLRRQADVRPLLGSIRTPTLILHRRDIVASPFAVEHGRYLAEHIPDAEYVELDGADNSYWLGDTELMLDEIEEFLTGVRHG
ncbi:MAG: alpha/beta hydrolase, partial [Actinomycetota bacterium]|nr:alpha/beta hydrolase [Actinomycetota bacterium]